MCVNVALIGCGYWGNNLFRNLKFMSECKLKKVIDLSEAKLSYYKKKFPEVEFSTNINEALSDNDISAVIIATPANTHYSIAKKALCSFKHVFVEKPFVMDEKQAKELVDLAEEKKLLLMVGHTFLYNSSVRFLKRQIESEIGDVYYIYTQRLNLGSVRKDINVWWNLAPHDVSILLYLLEGKKPKSISINASAYVQKDIEDVAFATLKWEDNVTTHIHVSWLDPKKTRKIIVVGSEKMIIYDDVASEDKIKIYDKKIKLNEALLNQHSSIISCHDGNMIVPRIETKEPLYEEMVHFINCILSKEKCITGPKHAMEVTSILAAGEKSIKNNGKEERFNYYESITR